MCVCNKVAVGIVWLIRRKAKYEKKNITSSISSQQISGKMPEGK